MNFFKAALMFMFISAALPAHSSECEDLASAFVQYDVNIRNIENSSFGDTSAPRESIRQAAVANILERKRMILDMMIHLNCDMPPLFNFGMLGYISTNGG